MIPVNKITVITALIIFTMSFAAEIHEAVAAGDTSRVRSLLDADPSLLDLRNEDGMTPLCLAAYSAQPGVAAFLIRRGADPLIGDVDDSQPLHCCGISGSTEIAKMLLEKGVPIDNRDDNGLTALHFAASRGKKEVMELLLDRGADPNARTSRDLAPLLYGVIQEDSGMIGLLLAHGADLRARSANGWTYLHYAAWSGKAAVIDLLVKLGLNDLEARDNEGSTPLGVALQPAAYPAAAKLVELGAKVMVSNTNRETPLHGAARMGSNETVRLLVEHGADVNAADNYGWTPLHNAAFTNSTLVSYLVEQGADPTGGTASGLKLTPLYIAAGACSLNSVRVLVEHGAPVNVLNDRGQTPLHYAVMNGRQDIVEYLLKQGAAVDTREELLNRGLLHAAAVRGYGGIAGLLIAAGADPDIKDERGRKPSAYAAYHGFGDLDGLLPGAARVSSANALLDRPLKSGEAAVWYLGNSGWAIRTAQHLLIFDYYFNPQIAVPGKASLASGYIVPAQLSGRPVTVFSSHEHGDHFSPRCFDWQRDLPGINYVLGFTPRDPAPGYIRLGPDETETVSGIEVSAIRSADAGVAFLVKVDGLVIFHAGDHANANADMTGQFPKDIDRLAAAGVKIDLSFFPITGCSLGDPVSVRKGVCYAIDKLQPRALFPMHGGDHTDLYQDFLAETKGMKTATRVMCAMDLGDAFLYQDGTAKPFK